MNFSKLDAYLDSFYRGKNIPGLGCVACFRHKKIYEHYSGFQDVENKIPFGPETIFHLYSATKVITAAAVMQLVEGGLCKLGDPVYEYIPEYRDLQVREFLPDGGEIIRLTKNVLTIEHLLSMQGGITGPDVEPVKRAVEASGGRAPTLDIVKALAEEPLAFDPGTRFKYSWCFDVLGGLVEAVSGKKLGAYLKERIFDPLEMEDTSFVPASEPGRMAKDYINFNAAAGRAEGIGETFTIRLGSEYECGGGGLYSTVPDYILFAEALCNGGVGLRGERILHPASIAEMSTNRLSGQAAQDFIDFGGTSKTGYGYGLGVRVLLDREKNNALSSQGEFGWDGARGCYVVIDPRAETALFYAQQEAGSPWWFWHGTIRNYLYACLWQD
jgi:CubicO group peptidase (beta-lactamase class C family)